MTSFASILKEIVDGCGGGLGAALMGNDGIPIQEVLADSPAARDLLSEEIGTAGAEFGRILAEIAKASDALGGGAVHETAVVLSRFTLIFRNVDEDTFVVVAIAPDGNLGKARYLIRRQLLVLRQEL
jgi:predicted regulator of Ras-like GTPase activity (Roadblock/LC7/MglB family)